MASAARDARLARIRVEEGALALIHARFEQLQRDELDAGRRWATLAEAPGKLL
ncbi:hypothetical protein EXIGLDRAFT_732221 [Exidia glandulosa HHB12029]|uniref:Uncharacterized protein n=1 Tax=Exidia glandulosa HHB12029 TaxID=1314781 RepID=A0A165KUA1_EXIGL|nr:hypothetical protein EXIGLDRAFT_732221 [Exidia glandulosa HHB12029]